MKKAVLGAVLVLAVVLSAVPMVVAQVTPTPTVVAEFNPLLGEAPEGIAVDRQGNFYVGMAFTGEVKRVTPDGVVSTFATLPPPGAGFMTGLAFDRVGNLYAALASFAPTQGIYRVTPDGVVTAFALMPADGLPNVPAFDKRGNLYVSDSFLARIWRIDPQGGVSVWKDDPLLAAGICPPAFGIFPVGANGIAFDHEKGSLYVANTVCGRIVRIPVLPDRSAGEAETFIENPGLLEGADGIALDNKGNLYVAVNKLDQIVVVSPDGVASVLTEGGLLQNPASVHFGAGSESKNLYITNFAVGRFLGAIPPPIYPALLKIEVGVPGRPLP